jgi:hypothetical protein
MDKLTLFEWRHSSLISIAHTLHSASLLYYVQGISDDTNHYGLHDPILTVCSNSICTLFIRGGT